MQLRRVGNWSIVCVLAVAFVTWWTTSPMRGLIDKPESQAVSINQLISGEIADLQFAKVVRPRAMTFPEDHGPHTDFRTEWWYFTGNLFSSDGAQYGYQFTIFRRAVRAEKPELSSNWAANQIYMAHVGLTDVRKGNYHTGERFNRAALELAGAEANPFRVWLDDWVIEGLPGMCRGCLDIQMQAATSEFSLSLKLSSKKPVVLHGDRGFSRKGTEQDNASYYYSLTRMATSGQLTLNGKEYSVSGTSWMDHEWFTSALGENQVGWDWFSIQLEDGKEIMYFQLRNENDEVTENSEEGTLVYPRGDWIQLTGQDVRLTKIRTWKSEKSESEYPVDWKLEIPEHELSLMLSAVIDNQERIESLKYWEGAIRVVGQEGGEKIVGSGYLEMTGY